MRDRRPHPQITGQALRRVERLLRKVRTGTPVLSEWEREFLASLKERLETYGSAFTDPNLGDEEEALSILQDFKLRQVAREARRKLKDAAAEGGKPAPKKPKSRAESKLKPKARPKPKAKPGNPKRSGAKQGGLRRKTPLRRKPLRRSGRGDT